MRRLPVPMTLALLATMVLVPQVNGGDTPRLSAYLDGRPIRSTDAGSWFCHDFEYPVIHCFSSASGLEAAIDEPAEASAIAAAFGPGDYVTIYSEPSYGGSYAHLSANYDTLFWIGWNDRISSYKVRNSQSGSFWEHFQGTGRRTPFCCNQLVPWLAADVDNTFTSVYRN